MIFPISASEAEVLHQLGWCSGYGWEEEWDWWPDGNFELRDNSETHEKLIRQIMILRAFKEEATRAAKHYIDATSEHWRCGKND